MSWLPRRPRPVDATGVPAILYTRRACPLCDEMKAELERAGLPSRWDFREVDVDGDPELAARLGNCVPVLEIGGRLAFRAHIRAGQLPRRAAKLARTFRRRGPGPGAPRAVEEV
jgi:glutaredoxin